MLKTTRQLAVILLIFVGISCNPDPDNLENLVPVSDAGPSQTITLPTNSVTVTGTGTDADGQVKGYLWSQVSGPETSNIVNPGSASTVIKGLVKGTYIFQLMVVDNKGATGLDTTKVTVNPGPQQTLTAQPGNNPTEKLLVAIGGVDQNNTGNTELVIDAWTVGGSPYIGRAALKFDLSSIPANATILSANLFLYSNTPPENGNLVDANFGTNNGLYLQQITSNWNPATTNWNSQPAVTTANQISIPSTTLSVLDLNIDVTSMVNSMVSTNSNYGFFLRLQNETAYTSRMFVSSYHATKVTKRPKLVVTYQ